MKPRQHGRAASQDSRSSGGEAGADRRLLVVRDVEKAFGKVSALRGVSLAVEPGEILALLGPNGAGKTTLVSIVAGLQRRDAGVVLIDGFDPQRDSRAARQRLGLATQELAIVPVVTAYENLWLMGGLAGLRGSLLKRRIEEVSEALLLTQLLGRLGRTLSGGEKRRLHTAMALLHEPPLIILDEPTAGADIKTRGNLVQLVHQVATQGSGVVYSTHYMTEVEELDARLAILDRGQLIAQGSVRDIIARHGASAVEVKFSGEIPKYDPAPGEHMSFHAGVARIITPDPYDAVHRLLTDIDTTRTQIGIAEIIKPSLEAAFLDLTGRRFSQSTGDLPHE